MRGEFNRTNVAAVFVSSYKYFEEDSNHRVSKFFFLRPEAGFHWESTTLTRGEPACKLNDTIPCLEITLKIEYSQNRNGVPVYTCSQGVGNALHHARTGQIFAMSCEALSPVLCDSLV